MATDFGTDINGTPDLDPAFSRVTGATCLGQALSRRLETPRGGLWYDPDYGEDVRDRLNDAVGMTTRHALESAVEAECEKDKRVRRASATATFDQASYTLSLAISVETAAGPFTFLMKADSLTVQLLKTL